MRHQTAEQSLPLHGTIKVKRSGCDWLTVSVPAVLSLAWLVVLFVPLASDFDPYGYNRVIVLIGADVLLLVIGVVSLIGACVRKTELGTSLCIAGVPAAHAVGYFLPEPINTLWWVVGTVALCVILIARGHKNC